MKNFTSKAIAAVTVCALALSGASAYSAVLSPFNNDTLTISAASTTGAYKYWKQSDPRWADYSLGSCGDTMKSIGCAVTSVAILMAQSGAMDDTDFNPGVLCKFLSSNGGFDGYGNIYWGAATKLAPSFTFSGGGALYGSQAEKTNAIQNYLNQGYSVMVSVKNYGHWVAIDSVSNGVVYMIDPANTKSNELFSVYAPSGVTNVRLFRNTNKSVPAVTTPVVTAPVETTTVTTASETETEAVSYSVGDYVLTDEVNLRKGADTSYSSFGTIPEGTNLSVSEVQSGWGKTSFNGNSGWISLDYAKFVSETKSFSTGTYITFNDLNLRCGIGTSFDVSAIIPKGCEISVTDISAGWGKVSFEGNDGWICLDFAEYGQYAETTPAETLPPVETTQPVVTSPETTATTVTTSAVTAAPSAPQYSGADYSTGKYTIVELLNFRISNSHLALSYGLIPEGTVVKVTATKGNWGKISYRGFEGWICLDYAIASASATAVTGDMNGDDKLTATDVRIMVANMQKGFEYTVAEKAALDVNGDGVISASDVATIGK